VKGILSTKNDGLNVICFGGYFGFGSFSYAWLSKAFLICFFTLSFGSISYFVCTRMKEIESTKNYSIT
jgi:hypothetical protein